MFTFDVATIPLFKLQEDVFGLQLFKVDQIKTLENFWVCGQDSFWLNGKTSNFAQIRFFGGEKMSYSVILGFRSFWPKSIILYVFF